MVGGAESKPHDEGWLCCVCACVLSRIPNGREVTRSPMERQRCNRQGETNRSCVRGGGYTRELTLLS